MCEVTRVPLQALRKLQRDVRREIAVLRIARALDVDLGVGSAEGGDDLLKSLPDAVGPCSQDSAPVSRLPARPFDSVRGFLDAAGSAFAPSVFAVSSGGRFSPARL